MVIETKFNPGDQVWVMKKDKPALINIDRIEIEAHALNCHRTTYIERHEGLTLLDRSKEYQYPHDKCFATKEELLQSFLNED